MLCVNVFIQISMIDSSADYALLGRYAQTTRVRSVNVASGSVQIFPGTKGVQIFRLNVCREDP